MLSTAIVHALGGVGLFLLGMSLLTDGLRRVGGDALREKLERSTRSPATGAFWGAVATAAVQSSSAITVMAVGFVGAGILSFSQALGIVFGANIGTTLTGWLVAVVGFELEWGVIAPLVVLVGALLRLFGGGRTWASVGTALAGFGLLFVGLDLLREGMSAMQAWLPLDRLPDDDLLGRLWLVLLGIGITLITQSSSAGIAMAITAVHTDTLELGQAAALVIGMDVGTTATAALATIGASLAARRTGYAHVVYNLATGLGAFLLLPAYLFVLERVAPGSAQSDPEIALVAFHSLFNLLGVLAVIPVARWFAEGMERLVPGDDQDLAAALDELVLADETLAMGAVATTLDLLARPALESTRAALDGGDLPDERDLGAVRVPLGETQRYLGRVSPSTRPLTDARRHAAFHVIDQLRRLLDRLEQRERHAIVQRDPELRRRARRIAEALAGLPEGLAAIEGVLDTLDEEMEARRSAYREDILRLASIRTLSPDEAVRRLDAWRWLERIVHHCGRLVHHLLILTVNPDPPANRTGRNDLQEPV